MGAVIFHGELGRLEWIKFREAKTVARTPTAVGGGLQNFRVPDLSFHFPVRLEGENFCLGGDLGVGALEKCSSPSSRLAVLKLFARQTLHSAPHGLGPAVRETMVLPQRKGIWPE